MHARLDGASCPRRVREQLDVIAELGGVAEVDGLDRLDALPEDLVGVHGGPERDGRQDRQLVAGVVAADVVGRVGLGEARRLGLGEGRLEVEPRPHPREHVVGRAVDHGRDALDLVRLEVARWSLLLMRWSIHSSENMLNSGRKRMVGGLTSPLNWVPDHKVLTSEQAV